MNQENLGWQYLFIFGATIANAYADGLIVRRVVFILEVFNRMIRRFGGTSEFVFSPFPHWRLWQWVWHLLKWTYFNLVLLYIVRACWHWPVDLIFMVSVVSTFFWIITYNWDAIYPTLGEKQ
jgi:hypothetical protein